MDKREIHFNGRRYRENSLGISCAALKVEVLNVHVPF
jgi:hypothetical protein